MDIIIIMVFGLLLGSFFNVCIYRIPREESIAFPPSHCGKCNKNLRWYDLIPVVSYVLIKGKCRYCGEKVSLRYPLIEMLTMGIFSLIYMFHGLSFELIKYIVLASYLIVVSIIDFETTDVYFKTTVFGTITGILFLALGYHLYDISIFNYILGGLIGGVIIALIAWLTKGMGLGDAEICFICGLYLGIKSTILMLFLSFVVGGLIGILLIISGKKSRGDYIPFGPFIGIAATLTILFGDNIIKWYLGFM